MKEVRFTKFLMISMFIHLVFGLILSRVPINYNRSSTFKVIEISLIDLVPDNYLVIAKGMVKEICERKEMLKFKEKNKSSEVKLTSLLESFQAKKEGMIEEDPLILKKLEEVKPKNRLKEDFISKQVSITKEILPYQLNSGLAMAKDIEEEMPISFPRAKEKERLMIQEDKDLLNNITCTTKISGPVFLRKILHQENFPIPSWLEREGITWRGKFKFWVLPDGYVDKVLVEESFGDRRVDSLASQIISKWRFSKLPDYLKEKEEWGLIDLKILLR
ncbi:MAG: energy transducer TonB [bacterium]